MKEITITFKSNVGARVVIEDNNVVVLNKTGQPLDAKLYEMISKGEGDVRVTVITSIGAILPDPEESNED